MHQKKKCTVNPILWIGILSKLSIFSNILIFIDLLLSVSCNTLEKRELNSKKIILLQFLYVDKTNVISIVWNHIFELLLQIIDDLVVFSKLIIYFNVIGISY
jgi:hypothetical protein